MGNSKPSVHQLSKYIAYFEFLFLLSSTGYKMLGCTIENKSDHYFVNLKLTDSFQLQFFLVIQPTMMLKYH